MQLFVGRNTEAGIKRIAKIRAASKMAREVEDELSSMKRQIEALQAKVARVETAPVHWSEYPVVKSTFQRVEARACKLFRLKRLELYSSRRHKDIALARHFVMYWACRLTTLSLPQIGRLMGGRDHTTILHGKEAYVAKRAKMGRYLRQSR